MFSSGGDGLKIIQDEKFYSRLLSKENSAANPSFRVYYGVASGAVPFHWESQPGTPKHTMAATTLPPLTPPPSYYSMPSGKARGKPLAKFPKLNIIHAILPRLALRKPNGPHLSVSSSTSSGSHRRGRSSSPMSSFSSNSRGEDEEGLSPTSTLCFGERFAAMVWMKKPSGLGSSHGAAA